MTDLTSVWRRRNLGVRGSVDLDTISRAIRAEQREAAQIIRLKAIQVSDKSDGLYEIKISGFPKLDWTWEGASAFRPLSMNENVNGEEEQSLWRAEVVGIEPDESTLFVSTSADAKSPPQRGEFLVKPFDFLAVLTELLTSDELTTARTDLGAYLHNSQSFQPGNSSSSRLVAAVPQGIWDSSWSALWGPPGTGKTHTIGQLVTEASVQPERILVVSTTNKATDSAAIAVARSMISARLPLENVVRLGTGADIGNFSKAGAQSLLTDSETELRKMISDMRLRISLEVDALKKAKMQAMLGELQRKLGEVSSLFYSADKKIVVSTAYYALLRLVSKDVKDGIERGEAPFSTVIIDEAGLVSSVMAAALALLAHRRVLFVGDPKQLAPISRMSRILPPEKSRWLASSALSKLQISDADCPHVHLLTTQYRMSPEIGTLVSRYQYEGGLSNHSSVISREDVRSLRNQQLSRVLWYVLDDDHGGNPASMRAARGAGNRSWERQRTSEVLDKLMKYFPEFEQGQGLFITPFAAQARSIHQWLKQNRYNNWSASTIHAQQGAEAEWVIFDTVHASSTGWPFDEWKRLINVAISRAREQLIILASRAEMNEPYLAPLTNYASLGHIHNRQWLDSALIVEHIPSSSARENPDSLGAQILSRRTLRPVLSRDQERLCGYAMDGKARLVRGVAGSGKTFVLANWLCKILSQDSDSDGNIWVLYANASLHGLIRQSIEDVWNDLNPMFSFPEHRVTFMHVSDLLGRLCHQQGLNIPGSIRFDYDAIAQQYLTQVPREDIVSSCDALFIDEAQDFGHYTLELCFALVKSFEAGSSSKAAMVFYDNAQDVYQRGTPTWSELGLDVRGRSTIMRESFRSTRPINEYALNVLFQLSSAAESVDYKELERSNLLEKVDRDGSEWWRVKFNRVEGPSAEFRKFQNREQEIENMVRRVRSWILDEGVEPGDIKVLCNTKALREKVTSTLQGALKKNAVSVIQQTSQTFTNQADTLIVSTAHSFKGYESELVVVPCAEAFSVASQNLVLSSALYVAMTRARSLLYISCTAPNRDGPARSIVDALEACDSLLRSTPPEESISLDGNEAVDESIELIHPSYREYVRELSQKYNVQFDPINRSDGSVLAEPVVWYESEGKKHAGFGRMPAISLLHDLEDEGVVAFEL